MDRRGALIMFGPFGILLIVFVFIVFKKLFDSFGQNRYDCNFEEAQTIKTAIEPLVAQSKTIDNDEQNKKSIYIEPGLESGIEAIKAMDTSFVPEMFISNSEQAFDKIFDAFANSQHQVLKTYLDENLYETFAKQIQKREEQNLRQEVAIEHEKSILKDIKILDGIVQIVVSFQVRQMIALVDIHGQSPDNPNKLSRRVLHNWVFQTSQQASDWVVVKTNSKEL